MTEWGVVGVLAALAGLAAAILKPMIKLNTTLTRLVVLVDELADKLSALEGAQSLMDGRIGRVHDEVKGYETRITILEIGGKRDGGV